jgi:hypothetical protein
MTIDDIIDYIETACHGRDLSQLEYNQAIKMFQSWIEEIHISTIESFKIRLISSLTIAIERTK